MEYEQRTSSTNRSDLWIGELREIPGRRFKCSLWWRISWEGLTARVNQTAQSPRGYGTLFCKAWSIEPSVEELSNLNLSYWQFFNHSVLWVNTFSPIYNDLLDVSGKCGRVVEKLREMKNGEVLSKQDIHLLCRHLKPSPVDSRGLELAYNRAWKSAFEKEVEGEVESRARLIAAKEYHETLDDLRKVEARCAKLESKLTGIRTSQPERATYVYIMKDEHNGLYKIGKSVNPKYRERTLQSEKPSIKMVFSTKERDDFSESSLHSEFAEFRIRGEWFDLTPCQVRYICHLGNS